MTDDFVAEAVEYALNPYQIANTNNISNNVFEMTFYNLSNKNQVNITNLTNYIDFFFPFIDN